MCVCVCTCVCLCVCVFVCVCVCVCVNLGLWRCDLIGSRWSFRRSGLLLLFFVRVLLLMFVEELFVLLVFLVRVEGNVGRLCIVGLFGEGCYVVRCLRLQVECD